MSNKRIIAIAASTGGIEALAQVLPKLPANIPPVALVIHMSTGFTKLYAARFNSFNYPLTMKEAETGDVLKRGQILIAPAGRHMKIVSRAGQMVAECFHGPKVQYVIPAADVLFESVAKELQKDAVGVILTGMGKDGADGLLAMRKAGALTIGQDRETSIIYGMPKVAFEVGAVQYQEPLDKIAAKIMSLL
ncbi:MAG: CheB methylesterase domain-containing protein [Defluviitaleaceae bacterium]|nr:CheB methylesterase domain-containing protein [Defluviitaleaceae bacterium]